MDSFMQNHQSALDSFMEDKAIQDLEDAGIYPAPNNDDILERLYEEVTEEWLENIRKNKLSYTKYGKPYIPVASDLDQNEVKAEVMKRFEELPEPGDYDD
tara:strand:- start:234 stop:533 length:300 start_codon:yes stop_codon:yes gene_type:complete